MSPTAAVTTEKKKGHHVSPGEKPISTFKMALLKNGKKEKEKQDFTFS